MIFLPASSPPHKEIADDVPADVRLEMTRLAVGGDARFSVSKLEIDLGLSFTVDTLAALRDRHAGEPLVFVAGSDMLLRFDTWHEPAAILDLATLAVAPRPGDDARAIARAAARWGAGKVIVMSSVMLAVSSSMIRERVRSGLPIRYLVPPAVERFVTEQRLYLSS